MVVKRGHERRRHARRWPSASAARGVILRFIEYMDVGATNGWQLDEVVPSAEIVERDRRPLAARAGRARLPRRGRRALPLPRRRGRDRPDLVRHAAVLPRLHARAPLGRGQALHLPVREPRPRPAGAAAQRAVRRRARRAAARASGACATTATRSCARRARRSTCPRSRCRTSAARAAGSQRASRARATSSSMRTCSRRVPSPTRAAGAFRRCLSVHDPGGMRRARPAGWLRRAERDEGDTEGHAPERTQSHGISEIAHL